MKNRLFYGLLTALLMAFVASSAKTEKRPNIVFILADDLGYADLGFTGSDSHQTPHLDKLATESVYFDHACASHSTCQPSRISLQTGKYPAHVGAVSHGALRRVDGEGNDLPYDEVTIGKAMQMSGYKTAHIGKWHVGVGPNKPKARGYDFNIASNEFCCPPGYFYPFITTEHGDKRDDLARIWDLDQYKEGDYLTDCLAAEASKFIADSKDDEPFFLNLAFYNVHTPLQAKQEKIDKYKQLIDKKTMRHTNPVYAAMVEHLDDAVGHVLQAVKDRGIEDNTIIIFFSDNGGATYKSITKNYPLRAGKGSMYEGGIRVPCLVKWPGVTKPNSRISERIVGYDWYPTILSMANAEGDIAYNKGVDGIDLSPILKDPNYQIEAREFHYLKYLSLIHFKIPIVDRNRCVETVIKGDWKLMHFFAMPDGYEAHDELYNLKDDPSETTDVSLSYPERVRQLKASMERWKTEIDAPRYDMEKFYGGVEL